MGCSVAVVVTMAMAKHLSPRQKVAKWKDSEAKEKPHGQGVMFVQCSCNANTTEGHRGRTRVN